MSIRLRPVVRTDEPFLLELYASTRTEELGMMPWSREQLELFLKMQFASQQRAYDAKYPGADHHIILSDDKMVGAIRISRTEQAFHLIDIALLPDYRSAGIGGTLLKELLAEALEIGRPVRLHVLRTNRAVRFYERLGFSMAGESGAYFLMEWQPRARGETLSQGKR